MDRFYEVQEFAELAGVTVKALRYYDRIGLLRPARTAGGYRVYKEFHRAAMVVDRALAERGKR